MSKQHHLPARILLRRSLLVAAVLGVAVPAAHSAWDVYPEVSVEAGFDDNLPLNVGNKDDATTGVVEGKIVTRNASETHNVQVTAALRQAEFGGTTQDGGTSDVAQLTGEKRSERISYGMTGIYSNQLLRRYGAIDLATGSLIGSTEDLLVAQRQNPSLDPNLEIGYIEDELRQKLLVAAPYVDFTLSDRNRLRLGGEYQDTSFSGDNFIGLEDSKQYGGSLTLYHQLNERGSGSTAMREFEPDNSPHVTRHDITVGISR